MAKLVQYKPDTHRKLGFRKVRKEHQGDDQNQLTLFAKAKDPAKTIQVLRHLDPFEKGLQLDEKNDALAETLYQEAIEAGISVADAHCNLGIIYARRGQTSMAISSFTKALAADPRHLEGHYNLANMYYDAGNYYLAATHYEVALEMEQAFAEIAFNLALAQICLDQRENAIKNLRRYLLLADQEEQKEARFLLNLLEVQG